MDGTRPVKPTATDEADQSLVGQYSVRDVAELLAIPIPTVRRCAREGLVSAERSGRGEYRFDFDAIVALRDLTSLLAESSPRRVRRALRRVRAGADDESGDPRMGVEGGCLVARDGRGAWNPLTGQALLDLGAGGSSGAMGDGEVGATVLIFPDRSPWPADRALLRSDDWFRLAYECEQEERLEDALEAYRRAVELDPTHLDAALNLGRLLHEAGRLEGAERYYRQVLDARPDDSLAAFNLGVLLEDQDRLEEALCAYELAIQHDPEHADAHYNAARLYQATNRVHRALWHFQVYRNLTR